MVDPAVGVRAVPAAIDLSERRHDLRHDVPVPFASDPHSGYGVDHTQPATGPADLGSVVRARAIQCALSRVCGLCGRSLSWGVTFVGSPAEDEAGAFHFPPSHRECAEAALQLYPRLGVPVLGQDAALEEWAVVVTGGFELVRPASRQGDMRVWFTANSVSERRTVPV